MLATLAVPLCVLLAPPALNAEGWDAASRTPEAIAAGVKIIERAERSCRELADWSVVETTASLGAKETLRWESRAKAKAWSWRAERGIEVAGVDDRVVVTIDSIPDSLALVECSKGCRAAFAEAGIVLPVIAAVRLGGGLGEACWGDVLPAAVIAGSRATERGTEVLLIDAQAGSDVLVGVDDETGLPRRVRIVQRLPSEFSHPALGAAPCLERTWSAELRAARPDPIALPSGGRSEAPSLSALVERMDPVRRRVPPATEPTR